MAFGARDWGYITLLRVTEFTPYLPLLLPALFPRRRYCPLRICKRSCCESPLGRPRCLCGSPTACWTCVAVSPTRTRTWTRSAHAQTRLHASTPPHPSLCVTNRLPKSWPLCSITTHPRVRRWCRLWPLCCGGATRIGSLSAAVTRAPRCVTACPHATHVRTPQPLPDCS